MSIFSILNTGANGLQTAQLAQNVTANNASNVDTPGFARRTAVIESVRNGDNAAGGGSRVSGIKRNVDVLLERRVLGARAAMGEATGRQFTLSALDNVFANIDTGLGGAISTLESSITNWSSTPGDIAARHDVLSQVNNLALMFNQAAQQISDVRADANDRVRGEISTINDTLNMIADLNSKIGAAAGQPGSAADLEDKRDALVRDLAQHIPVTTIRQENGSVMVLFNAQQTLVSPEGHVTEFVAGTDANGDVSVQLPQSGVVTDFTSRITGGSLGGIINARSTILQTQTKLDQLAYDVTTAYNAAHSAGFALDGTGGRNLFTTLTSASGAASAISVSSDVADHPENLAAATDAAEVPGDNRGVLALQALASGTIAVGNTTTASGGLSQIISYVGSITAQANTQADQTTSLSSQVDALSESVSGVSLDDEMVSLMKFQRSYQAALKVISAADQMLEDLINVKR